VDPELPAERVGVLLSDAEPVVVVDAGFVASVPWDGLSDADVTDVDRRASLGPENAAYLIFTSGSTGRPKGVLVEHRQPLSPMPAVAGCGWR
jgi:non-ribosomal peptide synthetase component F